MNPYYQDNLDTIYCGDALKVLRSLPDESIQMCMTSPPYYGLRSYSGGSDIIWGGDENCTHIWEGSEYHEHREETKSGKTRTTDRFYGEPSRKFNGDHQKHVSNAFCVKCQAWKGQLGLEPTVELYVLHLMMIFREVKRVLKKSGSFYLNIGDTYNAGREGGWPGGKKQWRDDRYPNRSGVNALNLKPKCMVCAPERVMFAMIDEGFVLRNKNIWHKPNSMPGSQKDRFTCSWEYLYFFTKNSKTILWRNRETGEWRDTRPTKHENYPWGGMYEHVGSGEFRWDKPPDSERDNWLKYQPLWRGFDYYFELDSIRIPHKTQSLERYQRGVNLGRPAEGKSAEIGPMQQYKRTPQWFEEMFPEDKDYKGKFDDLFGHGPKPKSFNLRVRDVKRGKGGRYVRGGKVEELKASEKEVREYEYTEKPDWRKEADKKGQLFNKPVAHQGGGNTGLTKRQENIVSHFEQKGSGGHYLYGGIESPEGTHEHPKGKNPGDYVEITTQPTKVKHYAAFPEALCVRPIKASSREGDTVLDPMAGTGTVGVVAKKLGREAILIDIAADYCEYAKERVSKIEYQPLLGIK